MMANDTETMVPMDLREVVRTRGNEWPAAHAVVLAEVGGRRVLRIWIGESEATWLALAIEKAEVPRPGTYALMARTIEAMGGLLREVRISRLADEVHGPFEAFFLREHARLFRALCIVAGTAHEAEDVTQEAFVRVLVRVVVPGLQAVQPEGECDEHDAPEHQPVRQV